MVVDTLTENQNPRLFNQPIKEIPDLKRLKEMSPTEFLVYSVHRLSFFPESLLFCIYICTLYITLLNYDKRSMFRFRSSGSLKSKKKSQ